MNNALYDRGMKARRKFLGDAHLDRSLSLAYLGTKANDEQKPARLFHEIGKTFYGFTPIFRAG